jgi:hypothetical protein
MKFDVSVIFFHKPMEFDVGSGLVVKGIMVLEAFSYQNVLS